MERKKLEELGLTAEQIDAVMKANGDDINREKAKFADYDTIKKQLETANATLEKFKDYDQTKADVEKYKAEAEAAKKEAAEKIAEFEVTARVKDFTGGKKFVNDFTRESINAQLVTALNDPANKGKSLDDMLKAITDGKENIFVDENKPTPPVVPQMQTTNPANNAKEPAKPLVAGWNRFKG